MTVSELMKAMADAGAPFEAILIAVRAIEAKDAEIAARDAQTAEKKAKDAARKRGVRGKSEENPRNVRGDGADIPAGTPLPLSPNENNSNPHTPAPEDTPRVREAADAHVSDWNVWRERNPFPRPHFAPPVPWADWLKCRKAKKTPNTITAHDKFLRDVEKICARTGWPPGRVFLACVEQGWAGIYETDEMKAAANGNGTGNRRNSPGHHGGRDNRDGFQRALDDELFRDRSAGRPATGGGGGSGELPFASAPALR